MVHSFVRWLVIATLVFTVLRSAVGVRKRLSFSSIDRNTILLTTIVFLVQVALGVWLYFISPMVEYFMLNFKVAVHQREPRFFGMEHITMMCVAALVIIVGAIRVTGRRTDHEKFKTALYCFGAVLFIVLISIPWGFPPLVNRPLLRWY